MTNSDCECGKSNIVNYTNHIIRDVLIAGVYDTDIRRDVLGADGITDRPVNDVIALIEKRMMARDANTVSTNMSAFGVSFTFSERCKLIATVRTRDTFIIPVGNTGF